MLADAPFTVTNVRKRKKIEHLRQSLTVLRKKPFKFHVTRYYSSNLDKSL